MLYQRIVQFKDKIASGELATMEQMRGACKIIVRRIEQLLPDDGALLKEWRSKYQMIKHSVKTFVKEPERSGAYAFLVDELGTKEGISNIMAAKIKKGVRDNVKLFHPEQQQQYQHQQQRPRNKGPRNGCFSCGGPHYANKCPFGNPPPVMMPAPPGPPPFMGRGRGRGRSGGRGRW